MAKAGIGIWLIGAKGGVAATACLGLCALKKGLTGDAGLVSQLPEFGDLGLPAWDDFLVGGHEIRPVALADEALCLATESRAIDAALVTACKAELDAIDARVRPGTISGVGPAIRQLAGSKVPKRETPADAVRRVQGDMAEFARANDLRHVVVVNVASTEPPVDVAGIPPTWKALARQLGQAGKCRLPASSLYAIAAMELGYSYINFTPSLGSAPAAIDELARLRGTRHMGCDG
jgi:myo-inositol-1-phosphate synthase